MHSIIVRFKLGGYYDNVERLKRIWKSVTVSVFLLFISQRHSLQLGVLA